MTVAPLGIGCAVSSRYHTVLEAERAPTGGERPIPPSDFSLASYEAILRQRWEARGIPTPRPREARAAARRWRAQEAKLARACGRGEQSARAEIAQGQFGMRTHGFVFSECVGTVQDDHGNTAAYREQSVGGCSIEPRNDAIATCYNAVMRETMDKRGLTVTSCHRH